MAQGRERGRAALGFSVHTGWAIVVAVAGPVDAATVLERRRLEMIPGSDPGSPRFVYHAARNLALAPAERLVRRSAELSRSRATVALKALVGELAAREYEVVAAGLLVAGRPLASPLEAILRSHALVHAAEGELFRQAVGGASRAAGIPVAEIRARELQARAAAVLGVREGRVAEELDRIGRAAGRPWAKDHRAACLAALVALPG